MGSRKVVLLMTVGTRDVALDGSMLGREAKETLIKQGFLIRPRPEDNDNLLYPTARNGGNYFFENFNKYKEFMLYPILQKGLDKVLSREGKVGKIYLVATDQSDDESVKKRDKERDTIHLAKIISEFLVGKNKGSGKESKNGEFMSCDPEILLVKKDVVRLDAMMQYWENSLFNEEGKKEFDYDNTLCYVFPVGGISAINTSLLITAIRKFKRNCIHLYADTNKEDAYVQSFVDDMLFDLDREKLSEALSRYDYVLAAEILEKRQELREYADLLLAAKNRLYFNFDDAQKIYDDLLMVLRDDHDFTMKVRAFSDNLCTLKRGLALKVRELYLNARIKYLQKQYVDFLLRMFRIEESFKRYAVENILGIFTGKENGGFKRFTEDVRKNKNLFDYLEEKRKGEKGLNWVDNPNNMVLGRILDYVLKENRDNDGNTWIMDEKQINLIEDISSFAKKIGRLTELRNNSIGAHGFMGVSKKKIEDCLKNKDGEKMTVEELFLEIEDIVNKINGTEGPIFENCIYNDLNGFIVQRII
jgi:hypothetical protein